MLATVGITKKNKPMQIPFQNKLRARLLAILILSIFVTSTIVGIFLYQHFHTFLYDRFSSDLQKYISLNKEILDQKKVVGNDHEYLKKFVDRSARLFGCRVTIIDTAGVVLVDSEVPDKQIGLLENHLQRIEIQQALKHKYGSNIRKSSTVGQNLLYMAEALVINNKRVGFLRLAINTDDVDALLFLTRSYFIIAGIVLLLLSSIIVMVLVSRINRNLYEIVRKARQIAKGELNTRIEIYPKDELSLLGENLNQMAQKLSESLENLKSDKNNLNTVLSSVQDGIIAIDPAKEIIFYNKQALTLIECPDEDIIGKSFFHVIRNQHLNSLLTNFFANPVFLKDDIKFETHTLDVIITSLTIEAGQGAVLVLRDVTHYKMLEKIRKTFVANVSHEFKTPLAAIRGYAESLLDWALDDESVRTKYVQKIVKQSNQLENLVSDLLELARIEKVQNIEFGPFDPIPLLKEIITEFSHIARSRRITIATHLINEPCKIMGDEDMFHSILTNLIDNAIKYTPEDGSIKIETTVLEKKIQFSIIDSGIGIPAKDLARIFERFYRVDKSRSRAVGGTGLGLSIVKHLAELQNAEIKVQSEPGTGSTFSVWFDLA